MLLSRREKGAIQGNSRTILLSYPVKVALFYEADNRPFAKQLKSFIFYLFLAKKDPSTN